MMNAAEKELADVLQAHGYGFAEIMAILVAVTGVADGMDYEAIRERMGRIGAEALVKYGS
jgi:hypothetical protein